MTRPESKSTMDFLTSVMGEDVRAVENDLGGGYVRLAVSEAARRQAKHDIRFVEDIVIELLRNARDAGASHIFVATNKESNLRQIVVIDDGEGIRVDMWDKVFEPRITSKLETVTVDDWGVHGRGMALYSIQENSREARVVASAEGGGTSIRIEVDTDSLSERADQSTLPSIKTRGSKPTLRGPHNILRTIAQFALQHPQIEVVVGSPSEIVATLRACSRSGGIADDLGETTDAADLCEKAAALGLAISERSAYRIISGRVAPQKSLADLIDTDSGSDTDSEKALAPSLLSPEDLHHDARGLQIAPDDMDTFKRRLLDAFDTLAEAYYLDPSDTVSVTFSGETVRATFHFEKQ